MAVDLAPRSSGPVVRAFDRVAQRRITSFEIRVNEAFDPDICPLPNLPWLAFHYGVDVWSTAWSEDQKRAVVRDAYRNFRARGTRSGLIAALGNLVSEVQVIEWWEEAATPGTFRVDVVGSEASTSVQAQAAIAEIIKRSAAHTRHYTITVDSQIGIDFVVGAGIRSTLISTITGNAA